MKEIDYDCTVECTQHNTFYKYCILVHPCFNLNS